MDFKLATKFVRALPERVFNRDYHNYAMITPFSAEYFYRMPTNIVGINQDKFNRMVVTTRAAEKHLPQDEFHITMNKDGSSIVTGTVNGDSFTSWVDKEFKIFKEFLYGNRTYFYCPDLRVFLLGHKGKKDVVSEIFTFAKRRGTGLSTLAKKDDKTYSLVRDFETNDKYCYVTDKNGVSTQLFKSKSFIPDEIDGVKLQKDTLELPISKPLFVDIMNEKI